MSKLKVFIQPLYTTPDRAEGGIRRVVEAQVQYLGEFGIEIVDNIGSADVTAGHGTTAPMRNDIPFVSHCHGLHWSDYGWHSWANDVNGLVTRTLLAADAITVPSNWVRNAITRGILRRPEVIYHGVDIADWKHSYQNEGYVIWDKARADLVSDPRDMQKVAALIPYIGFVSTFGEDTNNVRIIGQQPLPQIKQMTQRAGVYLATARETFGVATLQALASGVPVAGWRYGGQEEIVKEGETGYLAPFGDYKALAYCIEQCLQERSRLSPNCIEDVRARWGWKDKIKQYANLYQRVHMHYFPEERIDVSIIVTCHNLGKFVNDALTSIVRQQTKYNWECLVVDDASTDNSPAIIQTWQDNDSRFRFLRTPSNIGLSAARNYGFAEASGRYVINLDADDMMAEGALETLAGALDGDRTLHIVYGGLDTVNEDGQDRKRNPWPGNYEFSWREQMAHLNQLHYSAMMRRSVLEESGGYRERMWRAEDAQFWCFVTSYGFKAQRVTDNSTLVYRMRHDSKSVQEARAYSDRDGNWCGDFPWHLADDPQTGSMVVRESNRVPNAKIVPLGAQGKPTVNNGLSWNVFHNQAPLVSFIIPVGPGHRSKVIDALDSLLFQEFPLWEAIVINDSGEKWDEVPGAPYAKVLSTGGNFGPAKARNLGISKARGRLIYLLDCDDYLIPGPSLGNLVKEYSESNVGYVYSDYIELKSDRSAKIVELNLLGEEYNQGQWKGQHAINILISKKHLLQVDGFDEAISGWEDWELFLKLAVNGICGKRYKAPTFVYRKDTGKRRDDSTKREAENLAYLKERYADYYDGRKEMSNCCGGDADDIIEAKVNMGFLEGFMRDPNTNKMVTTQGQPTGVSRPQFVRMEYNGPYYGAVTYFGNNGREYRAGLDPANKFIDCHPDDFNIIMSKGVFVVIEQRVEPEPERPVMVQSLPTMEEVIPDLVAAEGQSPFSPKLTNIIDKVVKVKPLKVATKATKKKATPKKKVA